MDIHAIDSESMSWITAYVLSHDGNPITRVYYDMAIPSCIPSYVTRGVMSCNMATQVHDYQTASIAELEATPASPFALTCA